MVDIEALLMETRETVARIETKLDFVLETQHDHASTLKDLERWRWGIPSGLLTGLGGSIAAILALLGIHP